MTATHGESEDQPWALAERHRPLARRIAAKYAFLLDRSDGEQVALLAMYEAAKTYDPSLGAFATHAVWRATNAVRKAANDAGVIRLPMRRHADVMRISRVKAVFSIAYGRAPTRQEYVLNTGLEPETMATLTPFTSEVLSLDTAVGEDALPLKELLADDCLGAESELENSTIRNRLSQLIGALTVEAREIVLLRLADGLSYEEASVRTGVEAATLAKRYERAIKALRGMVAADVDIAEDLHAS